MSTRTNDLPWDQSLAAAAAKRTDHGAFDDRIFLGYIDNPG